MVRGFSRINKHGEYLEKKGGRWVKPKSSKVDPLKLRRWGERSKQRKQKEKVEEREP